MAETDYGNILFSVTECKLASYDYNGDVIGSPIDIDTVSMCELTVSFDTDTMKYTGANRRGAKVPIGGTLKITAGGLPLDVLGAIGFTNSETGVTPNLITDFELAGGGAGVPYVSLGFRSLGENGDDVHLGVIAAKASTPTLKAEQNKYGNVEIDFDIYVPTGKKVVYGLAHETATALVLSTLLS